MKKQQLISRINPLILKGVAHRGLWNKNVSENSMEAFRLAIELDIHLTKDNDLVVIHDEKLERLTGKSGIVEHLTTKELQENYKLLDGQTIPRFEDVLNLVNEQVPILVELKVYEKNYKPLAAKAEEVLSKYVKDKRNFVLISFDPRSLWPFKGKGYIRLLLIAKSDEYTFTWFKRTVEGLDVEKVLFEEKRVQRYGKKHFMNCWTIQSSEDIEKVLPYADAITFDTVSLKTVQEKFVK